jgi:hypothetical protein
MHGIAAASAIHRSQHVDGTREGAVHRRCTRRRPSGDPGRVPYERPLAGRAADGDGLKLDQILVRMGP